MRLWLVQHGGYDFDTETLAVCTTEKIAKRILRQRRKKQPDHPWNGCWIDAIDTDVLLVTDSGPNPKKGSLVDLAKMAGL